jgi:hypothetical protein
MDLLKTLLWVADQNAAEVRERERVRSRLGNLTAQQIEEHEWRGMLHTLRRRQQLLGADTLENEDDDGAALETVIVVLTKSGKPLTAHEVMRHLQRAHGLLSVRFPAAAKAQTRALLERLRVANRVWQDPYGRWSLL